MSVESSHQIAVETPWARSSGVVGVHCDLTVALPTHLQLQADLRNFRLFIL